MAELGLSGRDHPSGPISPTSPRAGSPIERRGFLAALAGLVVGGPVAKRVLPIPKIVHEYQMLDAYVGPTYIFGTIQFSQYLDPDQYDRREQRRARARAYYQGRQW